jgi:hypothetical protein
MRWMMIYTASVVITALEVEAFFSEATSWAVNSLLGLIG